MPKILMAVYDPAQPSNDGSFWVWRSPSLNLSLLDTFYYNIASKSLPENPNQLAENDIWGGAARHQDWFCVWRFLDGGRDPRGRPGRFVLTAAFIQTSDVTDSDVSSLFQNQMFQWIAQQAPNKCPIPQPHNFEEEIELPSMRPDPIEIARVMRDQRVEFRGSDALQTAILTGIGLPSDRQWNCFIQQTNGEAVAILQTQKPKESTRTDRGGPDDKAESKGPVEQKPPKVQKDGWFAKVRRLPKKTMVLTTVVLTIGLVFLVWVMKPTPPREAPIVNPTIIQIPNPQIPGWSKEIKGNNKHNPDPKKEDKIPSAKDGEKGLESKPKAMPANKGLEAKAPGGSSDFPKKAMDPDGRNNSVGKAPFVNSPESYHNNTWFNEFTNGFFTGVVIGVGVVIFLRCFSLKQH